MEINDKTELYQQELSVLLESRAVDLGSTYHADGPFEEAYEAVADLIVSATATFVALRALEDLILSGSDE